MNLPKVFEEKMKDLLGSEYEAYTACYDEPRHYGLRVNTAKISVEDFLKIAPWPLEPVPWIHNGFYYDVDLGGREISQDDLKKIESKITELPAKHIR